MPYTVISRHVFKLVFVFIWWKRTLRRDGKETLSHASLGRSVCVRHCEYFVTQCPSTSFASLEHFLATSSLTSRIRPISVHLSFHYHHQLPSRLKRLQCVGYVRPCSHRPNSTALRRAGLDLWRSRWYSVLPKDPHKLTRIEHPLVLRGAFNLSQNATLPLKCNVRRRLSRYSKLLYSPIGISFPQLHRCCIFATRPLSTEQQLLVSRDQHMDNVCPHRRSQTHRRVPSNLPAGVVPSNF